MQEGGDLTDMEAHQAFRNEHPGPGLRIGVYGASGTTGAELVRLLAAHPATDVAFGTSRTYAGRPLVEIDPRSPDLELSAPDAVDPDQVDVAFLCLPHGASAPLVEALSTRRCRVVDLSGDLRLRSPALHAEYYGSPRSRTLMESVVYGLPELNREEIRTAQVISNPGCYATSVILALAPLARSGQLRGIISVDAKSGVSGAGRKPTDTNHFCSAHDDIRPYNVGRAHRHVPEIEQVLGGTGGEAPASFRILFIPHLVPMDRGILATCVVQGADPDIDALHRRYREFYRTHPFVEVLPQGTATRVGSAVHTNRAVISLHPVEELGALVVTCAIDNLVKGAAGQAIQNMNLMTDLPEDTGLPGNWKTAQPDD